MQYVLGTIDTVYGWIIGGTLRFMDECVRLYTDPSVVEKEQKNEEEHDKVMVFKPPVFKAVGDVLVSYRSRFLSPKEKARDTVSPYYDESSSKEAGLAQKNTVMYADAHRVPIYKNPTIAFDEQIAEIPYGEMVIILEPRGRFYRVMWQTHEGWVLREDIADRAVRVYPSFIIGEENTIDSPNTARVRTLIGDVFGLARSEFALQAGEYVLYRLWRRGLRITWPTVRPRVPGMWHKILKGAPHIHIGVVPKNGAVMEYMITPEIGHLACVDALFPDDTITISEVNFPDSGIYNERVLTKEEWKELHPLFIEVTRDT